MKYASRLYTLHCNLKLINDLLITFVPRFEWRYHLLESLSWKWALGRDNHTTTFFQARFASASFRWFFGHWASQCIYQQLRLARSGLSSDLKKHADLKKFIGKCSLLHKIHHISTRGEVIILKKSEVSKQIELHVLLQLYHLKVVLQKGTTLPYN